MSGRRRRADMEVAVVGGGPAGLTAAILLAQLGIDARVYERRGTTSKLPRAHLLNQRTMEIFESIGVAADVYEMSPPEDSWHRVGWYTSLAGDLPGQGKEIGHLAAWGGGADRDRYAAASPARYANLPQMRLDPLLRQHAEARCPGKVHLNRDVQALRQRDGYVELDIVHTESGAVETITAQYVIAADGGRLCSRLLGIPMIGPTQLLDMVTMHITADLSEYASDDEVLLYYFIDPHGHGNFRGAMCAMGPDTWGTRSREWAIHQAFAWGDPAARDNDLLRARTRDMLGIPDLPMEVHAISHWEFEGVTAERFRAGDVFLVGNAAHRHPPTGGFGLNAAVQDVHNLAWKLALVLRERAGDALLDTYHTERHPVDQFNVEHSVKNVGGHRRVAAALGQSRDMSIEEGWREIETWLEDSREGQARRAAVAEAVASNADDYSHLNVELGYAYEGGALIPDGTSRPAGRHPLRDYVPSTRPGHHLPHAWLHGPKGQVSTLHLVPTGGFALFTAGEVASAWRDAAETAVSRTGVRIDVVALGPDGDVEDTDGTWERVSGTTNGAVLVRPDWHVAWRARALPADPSADLNGALASILNLKDI